MASTVEDLGEMEVLTRRARPTQERVVQEGLEDQDLGVEIMEMLAVVLGRRQRTLGLRLRILMSRIRRIATRPRHTATIARLLTPMARNPLAALRLPLLR